MSKRNDIIARAAIRLAEAVRHQRNTAEHSSAQWCASVEVGRAESALLAVVPATDGKLSARQLEMIRHALGVRVGKPRSGGFRNYYAPPDKCPLADDLVERGYMERGAPYRNTTFLHVTEEGAKAAACLYAWRKNERNA